MSTTIRLWHVRDTELAHLYTKIPPERHPTAEDEVWIPKSIVEGRSKDGNEHQVRLPDWWVTKANL